MNLLFSSTERKQLLNLMQQLLMECQLGVSSYVGGHCTYVCRESLAAYFHNAFWTLICVRIFF